MTTLYWTVVQYRRRTRRALPGMTTIALVLFIAGWMIATGVMQIIGAIRLGKEIDHHEWWLVAAGALSGSFQSLRKAPTIAENRSGKPPRGTPLPDLLEHQHQHHQQGAARRRDTVGDSAAVWLGAGLTASASVQMSRPADLAGGHRASRLAGIEAALLTREEVAAGFASILSQLDGIVANAKAKGQLSISVAALDGLRKTWADTARLAGHDRPADTNIHVNVKTGLNITIVVDKLLALVDDAATKEKLATALLQLDGMPASAETAPTTIDAVARPAPPAIDAGAPPAPDSATCDGGEPPAGGDSVLDRIGGVPTPCDCYALCCFVVTDCGSRSSRV